jgi:hypothetical protein
MKWKMVEREVLNPLGDIVTGNVELVPLPDDFEVVSLVNNTKPGAEVILSTIRNSLGNRRFIEVEKPAGAPATPQQLKNASEADLAILALGDCGSCTSWVILDAVRLEKMGVPTICISSDHFISFARELARTQGAEDLRILEVEHPLAGLAPEEVEDRALKIIPALQYLLQIP